VTAFLGSDVTVSASANTFTDILTSTLGGSPSGHTFNISVHVSLSQPSGGAAITVQLYDGTNILAETEINMATASNANDEANFPTINIAPASNITLHVRFTAAAASAGTVAKATTPQNGGGANVATWLTYQQTS